MALKRYQHKRKFAKTPEPKGAAAAKSNYRFVVDEHHASHLHYDFRLELPAAITRGPVVLKSWAVPKGIPRAAGIKHLAVAVEDHPVAYLKFHGVIPAGNYGAGSVKIWDSGHFALKDWGANFLKFTLAGKKLRGNYVLVKFGRGGNSKNWLLFKVKS